MWPNYYIQGCCTPVQLETTLWRENLSLNFSFSFSVVQSSNLEVVGSDFSLWIYISRWSLHQMECFLELSYWPSSLSCQLRSITSQIPSTSSCVKGSWNQDSALIRKGPVWMGLLVPVLVNLVPVQTCTESQGRYTYCKRMRHEWKEWDATHPADRESRDFHVIAMLWLEFTTAKVRNEWRM